MDDSAERPSAQPSPLQAIVIGKISRRLMPILWAAYLIAYIDRQNVSFAKLQMAGDIGLGEAAFGLGAAVFFLGYFLFEVPSNLILVRVGARRWFARIMASWGLATVLLGFTPNGTAFYLLRFLLGAAEAGLFPGVLFVLTLWYPAPYRARAVGLFLISSVVANVTGAAIAGLLLDLDGLFGLRGWQLLFVVTGIPAIALAPVVLRWLPDGPERAVWLSAAEKSWLAGQLAAEENETASNHGWRALGDARVALLCITFIGFPFAAYGLSYWLPTIVKDFGVSNTANGFINAALWLQVGLALWLVPRWTARRAYSPLHIVGPALIGAVALAASVFLPGALPKFLALCVAAAAIFAGQPTFWTLPPRFLRGAGAAAGFAAINAVGNLGGFAAQLSVPWIAAATGSAILPMLLLAAALLIVAIGVLLLEWRKPATN